MLQHLVFEDELEVRGRGNEVLLDGIARGGVSGDVGLNGLLGAGGRASRGARRSRALGGGSWGGGGVCLLAGRHGGFVCLRVVSQFLYSASTNALLEPHIHHVVLQRALRMARNLQEDVVGVVGVVEIWSGNFMSTTEAAGPSVTIKADTPSGPYHSRSDSPPRVQPVAIAQSYYASIHGST